MSHKINLKLSMMIIWVSSITPKISIAIATCLEGVNCFRLVGAKNFYIYAAIEGRTIVP